MILAIITLYPLRLIYHFHPKKDKKETKRIKRIKKIKDILKKLKGIYPV